MATALLPAIGQDPFANQCIDPSELDSFVDFGAQLSPPAATSKPIVTDRTRDVRHILKTSLEEDQLSLDQTEDPQKPAKPSHEYNLYKQQTGIPLKSVPGLESSRTDTQISNFFTSGFDESSFMPDSSYDGLGSMSGLGLSNDVNMDIDFTPSSCLPAFFFPPTAESSQSPNFVNPSTLGDQSEIHAHVRVWPGMHQQQAHQAALAKAREQSQRHETSQPQKQSTPELSVQPSQHGKKSSQPLFKAKRRTSSNAAVTDAQTEAVINRVVNQIVRNQNSALASGDVDAYQNSTSGSLSNLNRLRKDEDDMDEDEKLLASEEGKKLSSKERRQLRNKVSARAFRSRRKEYISQLESEVASKVNEANELRTQNEALMEENARSREFIERLLRHPAFHPFLDDLSRDPAIAEAASQKVSSKSKDGRSVNHNSDAVPQIQDRLSHDESPSKDSSEVKESLSGNPWPVPDMDIGTFESPNVFAVLDLPRIERLLPEEHRLFDKDEMLSVHTDFGLEKDGSDATYMPAVDVSEKSGSLFANDAKGPGFDLFDDQTSTSFNLSHYSQSALQASKLIDDSSLPANLQSFNESINDPSFDRIRRICTRMNPIYARISSMTAHLEL